MRVDQAIYTSLSRGGRGGYHVVSRSIGVSDADAAALAAWSPSHGALIVDDANGSSVNFHPLTDGRLAISRTREGPPEYSGRGGRQIYTHALIFEATYLERSGARPLDLFGDALALGVYRYRPDPRPVLDEVELGRCHPAPGPEYWEARARELGLPDLAGPRERLLARERIHLQLPGNRLWFARCLLGSLPRGVAATISVSTSLQPSSARPFQVCLHR